MPFNLKNKDIQLLERIENELSILCQYNLWTTSEEQETVDNLADCRKELQELLTQINEKLEKDRAKTWEYIKEKERLIQHTAEMLMKEALLRKRKIKCHNYIFYLSKKNNEITI